eukprot:PhF_6_TR7943/c0_g1_i1/m.11963
MNKDRISSIAGLAKGILRFLPLRGNRDIPQQTDTTTTTDGVDNNNALLTICRLLQETAAKGSPIDEGLFTKLVQIFHAEIEKAKSLTEEEAAGETAAPTAFASVFGRKSKSQLREERHLYFLQVIRLVCKSCPHLVPIFVQHNGLSALKDLMIEPASMTKVSEAATSLLLDLCSDFPEDVLALAETFLVNLLTQEELAGGTRPFRGLLVVYHLLKRWDLITTSQASAAKLREAFLRNGAIDDVLRRVDMYMSCEVLDALLLAHCVLLMSVVGGCVRGCGNPARLYIRESFGFAKFFALWMQVLRKMDGSILYAEVSDVSIDKSSSKRSPTASPIMQRVASFDSQGGVGGFGGSDAADPSAPWVGEMMDLMVDVMTNGESFPLLRQLLNTNQDQSTPEGTPRAHTPKSPANEAIPRSSSYAKLPNPTRLLQWHVPGVAWTGYPSSLDFDVTSNAATLWKYVCFMSRSVLEPAILSDVVVKIGELPQSFARFMLIVLLLLCRATSHNCAVFAKSQSVDVLINQYLLQPGTYPRNHTCWQLCASIVMCVTNTCVTPSCIHTVLKVMQTLMSTTTPPTTTEEVTAYRMQLDVANVILRSVPQSSASQQYLMFDGMKGCHLVGTVDKWPSQRTGYTMHINAYASCVWQGGMTLFAIYEVATKEVVLSLQYVPWHGSKFIAITTVSKQQRNTTVLRDRAVDDGWHKVSVFHHRNGITVTVDGKKLDLCQSNFYPSKACQVYLGALPYVADPKSDAITFMANYFGRLSSWSIHEGPAPTTTAPPHPPVILPSTWTDGPMTIGVEPFVTVKTSTLLVELDVLGKAFQVLLNSSSNAEAKLLALKLIAVISSCDDEGTQAFQSAKGFDVLAKFLQQPGDVTSECVDAILELASLGDRKNFRKDKVEWTHQCLGIVLKVLNRSESLWGTVEDALLCRATTLRRLSEVLTNPENAALWLSGPGLSHVLKLNLVLPSPYIPGIVAVVEKLCSSQAEVELILAFAVMYPSSDFTLLLLRMLNDVCKATIGMAKMMAGGNFWNQLLYLSRGSPGCSTSELIRVQSVRLYAFLLHVNEKSRNLFLKGQGFDILATALSPPTATTPCSEHGIPTYDCLFQFAMDGYQPPSDPSENGGALSSEMSDLRYMAAPCSTSPTSECAHTPSLIVLPSPVFATIHRESILRSYNFAISGNENAHDDLHSSNQTIIYAHAVRLIFQLLPRSTPEIVKNVAQYMEKVVSVPQNMSAILVIPSWVEWLIPVVTTHGTQEHPALRSLLRRFISRDMCASFKTNGVTRLRELGDCTDLQIVLLEEFINHLSSNSRLDVLDTAETTALLKNMELLFAVDEYLHPLPPDDILLAIVRIIGAVAATSGAPIRAKMKSTKLFDIRDRLAFYLIFVGGEKLENDLMHLEALLSCCPRDPNASVVLLKLLADALQVNKPVASSYVTLLRTLYAEDEQRKIISKLVGGEADLLERLVSGQKAVTEFVSWCEVGGGGATSWNTSVVAKLNKAYTTIDTEMNSRAEKRQRALTARIKTRKQEEEKKVTATQKQFKEEEDRRAEVLRWAKEKASTILLDAGVAAENTATTTTTTTTSMTNTPSPQPEE